MGRGAGDQKKAAGAAKDWGQPQLSSLPAIALLRPQAPTKGPHSPARLARGCQARAFCQGWVRALEPTPRPAAALPGATQRGLASRRP